MKNKSQNLKYSQAVKELEGILSGLKEQEIDVDDLSAKVKRAMEIINFCKSKISSTEMEIKSIMKMFEENKEG